MPAADGFALYLSRHRGQPPDNQANKQQVRLEGRPGKHHLYDARQRHHANGRPKDNGDEDPHAFLKFRHNVGRGMDNFVINTHGNCHRTPADARDDIGNADYHAF